MRGLVGALCVGLIGTIGCGDSDDRQEADVVDTTDVTTVTETTTGEVVPTGPTDCVIGTLACSCGEGGGCALDPDGEPLTCVAGVCLLPTCPRGQLGCECRNDDCNEGECVDGMCVKTGCEPGTLECACAAGGCNVGLFCKDATVCVDQSGYEGGKCLANGACNPGNRCDATQNVCVFCDRGTAGCHCTTLGSCAGGLTCAAGLCTAAADLPPENPVCYTPCRRDLVAAGETRVCSAEGLMAGCIDDQSCVDGSCVAPGQAKPECATEVDCPFFQTCLDGGCYSNCESNLDCSSGLGCHKKVCRVPCSLGTGGSSCPASMTCDSADGQTGLCAPIMPPDPEPLALPGGAPFTIQGTGTLALTNLRTQATLHITPAGSGSTRIVIRKVSHDLFEADGEHESIAAPVDANTGARLPCEGAATSCPLWWIEMSDGVTTTRGGALEIVCNGTCPEVKLSNAGGSPGVRYDGTFTLTAEGGKQDVSLRYVEEVSGRWEGQVHYFTAFNDEGVAAWKDRNDKSDVTDVKNALIQRWGAFRRGNLEGWAEFDAVLTSTRTGSWNQPRVRELCKQVTGGSLNAVCYPFTNAAGVRPYVQDVTAAPVPSATTELPIAFQIRAQLDAPQVYSGRIDSQTALHYPGNPAVTLTLEADPSLPGACDPAVQSACVVYLEDLKAEISVGARYVTPSAACAEGFKPKAMPWLIPGFIGGTRNDATLGRVRTECRDTQLPALPIDDIVSIQNQDQAGANPAPDGLVRHRSIELLDGALVDQTYLFALVKETFVSFVPGQPPVSAYGFMTLKRTPVDLTDADFVGTPARAVAERDVPDPGASCDPAFLETLPVSVLSDPNALVRVLIEGSSGAQTAYSLDPISARDDQVHYLCDGYFDGGGEFTTIEIDPFELHLPKPCLPGEEVTFFDTGSKFVQDNVLKEPCQSTQSCRATLDQWISAGIVVELEPTYRCEDPSRALCDDNRDDLRDGKVFFRKKPNAQSFTLPRLGSAIDEAFRYKTRFQSSLDEDSEVGFAPSICDDVDARPYCYSPSDIEAARTRVDCLVSTYTKSIGLLDDDTRAELQTFLRGDFAETQGHDGFERLYAELLVMLGDEELTGAFASRFDLAGLETRNFEGEHFEIDGMNLSGVAGAEMQRLYAAVQYYEMALDRLYRLGPDLAQALARGDTSSPANFVSPQTVTLYLGRLVRASSQQAFAWSEIAKRYRDFNRVDIARRVLERAYARTYLESVMLARLMLDIAAQTGASFKDQIVRELETAQRTFRVSMLDMRDVFETIVQGATFFGFPAEYVPFPAVDTSTTEFGNNGFDVLLNTARARLATAKEREQIAFDSLTSGRLDSAQFQSELVRVRNNYEDQLATLCGVFKGDDGATYPAIRRYAERSQSALIAGDPCALFGNGSIYESMLGVDAAAAALEGVLTRYRNVLGEIDDEQTRVAAQCDIVRDRADFEYQAGDAVRRLTRDKEITSATMNGVSKLLNVAKDAVGAYAQCTQPVDGVSKGICGALAGVAGGLGVAGAIAEGIAEGVAIKKQFDIAGKQLETGRWITEQQCDVQLIDSAAKMAGLIRSLDEVELEALRSQVQVELEAAEVARMFNEAQRLQERQVEAQQQLIDVEAARNDPNVRIYRNDAIINADIAFDDAMRAAYRATRMYEYYTSTSYDRLDELFLIRLAARGRPNLENYLTDLENAFQTFEEELGLPDARVAIISLRDDILQIPYLRPDKLAYTQSERIAKMVETLEDPSRLDKNGYIVVPFGTTIDELSPLTRNHKIRYIEANVIGSETGDWLGRIYLKQRGTSVLQTVDDRTDYYVFPERTAVVDVFFNGNRIFAPEIYQNLRLRDRPYAQTMWELVFNRRDEAVNRDIDLKSISDIQILIHYTDFTVF